MMPVLGPQIRVFCEDCDVERTVNSRVLAEDMVEGHREQEHCSQADWEEVDDGE